MQKDEFFGRVINSRAREFADLSPRIAPLREEDLSCEMLDFARNINKAFGNDDGSAALPQIFLILANNPELGRMQLEMGARVAAKGTIPLRQQEMAILRVAWLNSAPFIWSQHSRFALSCGLTTEEIASVSEGSEAENWSEFERAILKGVEEMVTDAMVSDETWKVLSAKWSKAQLIEFLMLVGRYVSSAMLQNSLMIGPAFWELPDTA